MGIFEDALRLPVTEFGGTKPLYDPADLPITDALVSKNCRFSPGVVQTRTGFALLTPLTGDVTTSLFFYSDGITGKLVERLAYIRYTSSTGSIVVSIRNTGSGATTDQLTIAGTALALPPKGVYTSLGPRLYLALTRFDTSLVPTRTPYVWTGNTSDQMIECFQRPMINTTEVTIALTQPSAGVVTAGTHKVGILFVTKAGYTTRPGPVDSTITLVPASIASTGANNILVTVTPASTWPTWIASIQVILTPADNDMEYYVVPGATATVTPGSGTAATISVNIEDDLLVSVGSVGAGTLADPYFSLLSMNSSNAQPINVNMVLSWGQRTVWIGSYGGIDTIFPSDPGFPEQIAPQRNSLQLPGGKPISSAFVMRGVLYAISSAGGMYAWVDNGGDPVSFSPPSTVDEKITTLGYYSTSVSASGGYTIIASQQGLYQFSGGALASIPLSYYQSPRYNKIAFAIYPSSLAEYVQVLDFPSERLIVLKAYMLDTSIVEMLTWDYAEGMTPEKVKFSNWTRTVMNNYYPAMALAKISNLFQLLDGNVKSATESFIHRLKSIQASDATSTLYSDDTVSSTAGIDWQYQTALVPKDSVEPMWNHVACRMRATALYGTPAVTVSVKSLDDARTITVPASPITLAVSPGRLYSFLYDATEEFISYLFTNAATDNYGIRLTGYIHFYDFLADNRD